MVVPGGGDDPDDDYEDHEADADDLLPAGLWDVGAEAVVAGLLHC